MRKALVLLEIFIFCSLNIIFKMFKGNKKVLLNSVTVEKLLGNLLGEN